MPTVFLPGIGATMRHARHLQVQGQVVGEGGDLVDTQAGFERDLVLRDDRAGVDADDLHVQAEVGERLFEQRGDVAQPRLVLTLDAAGSSSISAAAVRRRFASTSRSLRSRGSACVK